MSIRIQLRTQQGCFTNFDYIEGQVIMSIMQNETIAAITVKLEGESRTRLAGMTDPRAQYNGYGKEVTQLEVHKVSEWFALADCRFKAYMDEDSVRCSDRLSHS